MTRPRRYVVWRRLPRWQAAFTWQVKSLINSYARQLQKRGFEVQVLPEGQLPDDVPVHFVPGLVRKVERRDRRVK